MGWVFVTGLIGKRSTINKPNVDPSDRALDRLQERFGAGGVRRASLLDRRFDEEENRLNGGSR